MRINYPKDYKHPLYLLLFCFVCMLPFPVYSAVVAPSVHSDTAIVIEATTGKVLYEKNADVSMLPASMTKVMTSYIVFEEIQEGNLTLDTKILVTANHAYLSTGTVYFPGYARTLVAGNYETVETLLRLIFQQSASVPCLMLAEHISGSEAAFVERMNQTAQRLSMNPSYENCHGAYSHYITARDQARLLQEIITTYPIVLDYCATPTFTHRGVTYGVVSQLINPKSSYYLPEVTGMKIGATTASGKCLSTTVERDGVTLIVVTFRSTTLDQCYQDHHKLIDYGFARFGEETSYFQDLDDFPQLAPIYEAFRDADIQIQAMGGYVRPTELITLGEFSLTFISALEQVGLLDATNPLPLPFVWDLTNAYRKDILYRGIDQGILPVSSYDSYSPTVIMPQTDIHTLFTKAKEVLSPDGDSSYPLYQGWELDGESPLTRGNAILLILGFLHDYDCFTHLGNDSPKITTSPWATDTTETALYFQLVPDSLGYDYTTAITREQTADLLVQLVETSIKTPLLPLEFSPFQDTDSLSILKATNAGIVYGVSEDMFHPDSLVTRQELAVMLTKTIDIILNYTQKEMIPPTISLSLDKFEDVSSVASWAIAPLTILLEREVLTGTSDTALSPEDHASIEQCIALSAYLFQGSIYQ